MDSGHWSHRVGHDCATTFSFTGYRSPPGCKLKHLLFARAQIARLQELCLSFDVDATPAPLQPGTLGRHPDLGRGVAPLSHASARSIAAGALKFRRGGGEEIPLIQGKEQQLHFAGAAIKRYPTSKVRETQIRRGVLREVIRGQTH